MSEARFRKIITGMTIKTQTQYHIIMKAVSSQSRRHTESQETHLSKQASSNNVIFLTTFLPIKLRSLVFIFILVNYFFLHLMLCFSFF